MRPAAGGKNPYGYMNNAIGYTNQAASQMRHHHAGYHPHHHRTATATATATHVYEAPSGYATAVDVPIENHRSQQYYQPQQDAYYASSHHHSVSGHYHGSENEVTGYVGGVDMAAAGNYRQQQQQQYETAVHHPQVLHMHSQQHQQQQQHHDQYSVEDNRMQLRQQQQNILNRLASSTVQSPGSLQSNSNDNRRNNSSIANQRWDVNLVAQEFENLQQKQRQQRMDHFKEKSEQFEEKTSVCEQHQYTTRYEYGAANSSNQGYKNYGHQQQLQYGHEPTTVTYEAPVNKHYATPGNTYTTSTGATVYEQPQQHQHETYYTVVAHDNAHGGAPGTVYYSSGHSDSQAQLALSQPQQVVVYDSYNTNDPVNSQYQYQQHAEPTVKLTYGTAEVEDEDYEAKQNSHYLECLTYEKSQIEQQAQLRKQILELQAKASRDGNNGLQQHEEKVSSYGDMEIDQSYPQHTTAYPVAVGPTSSSVQHYQKNHGFVQAYDKSSVSITLHNQSGFVNLVDGNVDDRLDNEILMNDTNNNTIVDKTSVDDGSSLGASVTSEIIVDNSRARPMYSTQMLDGVVSPNPIDSDIEVDDWWPNKSKLSAEPKVEETLLESKSSSDKEELVMKLQKMPHCKIHNLLLRESGGILFKKAENNKPMFCWQVTEQYPTEPMVCCSKCHTWRHACCGGHNEFKGYDTIPTDMPSEFSALCDLCSYEERTFEKRLSSSAIKKVKRARIEHLKRVCAVNEVAKHSTFHKYGGTYKWPIGSVIKTHINGHTRSIYGRQEKASKILRGMVTKLGDGIGSTIRPRERVKVRTKELEKLVEFFEDAESFTDRHNMKLFLHMDTAAEQPVGYENEKHNFFDPANYPNDKDSDDDIGNDGKISESESGTYTSKKAGGETTKKESVDESSPSCAREGCINKPRFDSAYCSDRCGIHVIERHLLKTLEYAEEIHPAMLK